MASNQNFINQKTPRKHLKLLQNDSSHTTVRNDDQELETMINLTQTVNETLASMNKSDDYPFEF